MSRGGVPDIDCPNDADSVRYWAYVGTEETATDDVSFASTIQSRVRGADAMGAFGTMTGPSASFTVADPAALARQAMQQALPAPGPVPPTGPSAPAPAPTRILAANLGFGGVICFVMPGWGFMSIHGCSRRFTGYSWQFHG